MILFFIKSLVWIIKFCEKSVILVFFVISKTFLLIRKIFNKTILRWGYQIYKITEKRLNNSETGDETTSELETEKNFLRLVNKKYFFHAMIIILAVLVATNSLEAKNKIDTEGGTTDSIILNLLSSEIESEVIIEEGVPDALNTPATYSPGGMAVSALPQMRMKTLEEQEAETTSQLATSEGSAAIMKPAISTTAATPRKRTEIIEYAVQEGDTISGIAQEFGISSNTVLWENGLSKYSLIRPGQTLQILPVSGLTHTVKRGENLSAIAEKYQAEADEVINENKLADASDIKSGQNLIIPNGIKPTPVQSSYAYSSSQTLLSRIISEPPAGAIVDPKAGTGHRFPWGQCTWYVSQKRYVPWRGHAKQWITNARAMGYKIGTEPVPGSIIVTKESWWGHVSYVEKVTADTVTFSEMNHKGLGVLSYRTLKKTDKKIVGYIY